MGTLSIREERRKALEKQIKKNPFLTDEELSEIFHVSVATIRADRGALGILEYRERIKDVAFQKYNAGDGQASGVETLDYTPLAGGIFTFETEPGMAFEGSEVVRGCEIYSYAEKLAIRVIEKKAALVNVANIKYKEPVKVGSRLVAKSEVIRIKNDEYIVWVKIKFQSKEVFRSKFILKALEL